MAFSGSSSSEQNPYAPSAVVEPRSELAGAGIGAWRDGKLIVLHRDATLPAICVKTGAAATHWLAQTYSGHDHLFSFQTRRFNVRVPLSARRHWMATRLRWWLLSAGIVILFGIPALVLNVGNLPEQVQVFTIFGGMGLATPLLLYGAFLGDPVQARRFGATTSGSAAPTSASSFTCRRGRRDSGDRYWFLAFFSSQSGTDFGPRGRPRRDQLRQRARLATRGYLGETFLRHSEPARDSLRRNPGHVTGGRSADGYDLPLI